MLKVAFYGLLETVQMFSVEMLQVTNALSKMILDSPLVWSTYDCTSQSTLSILC